MKQAERYARRNFIKHAAAVAVGGTASLALAMRDRTVNAADLPESSVINMKYYTMDKPGYSVPASVQMVLGYLLDPVEPPSQDVLAGEMYNTQDHMWYVVNSFRNRGFVNATDPRTLDNADLYKSHLSKGWPVIARGMLGTATENTGSQHTVVAIGYNSSEIIFHDPGAGGPNRHMKYDDFVQAALGRPGETVVPYTGKAWEVPEFPSYGLLVAILAPLVITQFAARKADRRTRTGVDRSL